MNGSSSWRSEVGHQTSELGSPRPAVVAFLNRKGGVGKTSCCHHLAGYFARSGRRVLLVDADPQASLTKGFLGPDATSALEKTETLACLFDDAFEPEPSRLVRGTHLDGVSLVPSSPLLDAHNRPEPGDSGQLQYAMKGQVPPDPDQLKDDTVASATRSRSAIKFIYIIHI